jgi:hypothetical protein
MMSEEQRRNNNSEAENWSTSQARLRALLALWRNNTDFYKTSVERAFSFQFQ